jgi:hypothetical protein
MPRKNVGRFRERPDERELDPTPARRERIPADRAPECVTPTRVEPAPWCHRPERRDTIWTRWMQRYKRRSRPVRCGLDDAFA